MTDGVQKPTKGPLILGILIITVGVGWLLTVKGFAPNIDWIWTLGLGILGVLTFVVCGGLDKVSVIIGPFFLIGSALSILRQTGRLDTNLEVPVLVILVGVLVVIAQMPFIPAPNWAIPRSQQKD